MDMPSSARPAGHREHPYDAWHARLAPLMYVHDFRLLYPAALVKLPPLGADIDGALKADYGTADDREQRRHYLDAFERILDLFTEFGVRHREHPKFELGGRVERGPELLTGELLKPDRLITECRVYFHLLLAQ